jgi:hypothetical protein
MKTIIMFILTAMMVSPALAFDQTDLDNLNSYQELLEVPEFDSEGFEGGEALNSFLGRRRFVCVAQNARGARYRAEGKNRENVRRRALRQCRRDSFVPRTCEIIRCKREGGKFQDFLDLIDLLDGLQN